MPPPAPPLLQIHTRSLNAAASAGVPRPRRRCPAPAGGRRAPPPPSLPGPCRRAPPPHATGRPAAAARSPAAGEISGGRRASPAATRPGEVPCPAPPLLPPSSPAPVPRPPPPRRRAPSSSPSVAGAARPTSPHVRAPPARSISFPIRHHLRPSRQAGRLQQLHAASCCSNSSPAAGSTGGSAAGAKDWRFFLAWYLMSLDKNRIATKAVTSAVLTLAGDLICQLAIDRVPKLDLRRAFVFTFLGLALVGPTLHVWYLYLSKLVTVSGASGAIACLILDQHQSPASLNNVGGSPGSHVGPSPPRPSPGSHGGTSKPSRLP